MSRQRQKKARSFATQEVQGRIGGLKALRVALLLAGVVAAAGVGVFFWEAAFSVAPERLVTVYRVHGCSCVFSWARQLEERGFVVKLFEFETLEYVRTSLHTPEGLNGCHLGRYLGYFVEGHVDPDLLMRLAESKPAGLGVAVLSKFNAQQHPQVDSARQQVVFFAGSGGKADVQGKDLSAAHQLPRTKISKRPSNDDMGKP